MRKKKSLYTLYSRKRDRTKPLTMEQEKETVLSDAEVAWIELPETYRYQRLFEKAYLVNEKEKWKEKPLRSS